MFFGENTFPQSFYSVLKKAALFCIPHFRNLVTSRLKHETDQNNLIYLLQSTLFLKSSSTSTSSNSVLNILGLTERTRIRLLITKMNLNSILSSNIFEMSKTNLVFLFPFFKYQKLLHNSVHKHSFFIQKKLVLYLKSSNCY